MKKLSKIRASLALAAMVVGAGSAFAPSVASAQIAHAPDGLGDVLIFPYYNVNDGWQSLFHITNTSAKTVAVKVRFREALESVDVYDFNVVLSPYDVFTGWVDDDNAGIPNFYTTDNSCTSPNLKVTPPGTTRPNSQFATAALPSGETDRIKEGYMEVIMMGASTNETNAVAVAALHGEDGKPADCVYVDNAFRATSNDNNDITVTRGLFGGNENVLKGQYSFINPDRGVAAGGEPITLKNFAPAGTNTCNDAVGTDSTPRCDGPNLLTAQEPPFFLFPHLASGDDNLEALETAIAVNALMNEWSNNPENGVTTDWVITQPTKHFHVDYRTKTDETAQAIGAPRIDVDTSFDSAWSGECSTDDNPLFEDLIKTAGTDSITVFDREEASLETTTTGTVISPNPQPKILGFTLCPEVNVLTFGKDRTKGLFGSNVAQIIKDLPGDGKFGWARIPMNPTAGVPAAGFAMWTREFGGASASYGHLVDHAYERPEGTTNPPPPGGGGDDDDA